MPFICKGVKFIYYCLLSILCFHRILTDFDNSFLGDRDMWNTIIVLEVRTTRETVFRELPFVPPLLPRPCSPILPTPFPPTPVVSKLDNFLKDFIYLFIFRERGREGEKHQYVREKHWSVASCASTRDLACNPSMRCDLELNRGPFCMQAGAQSTEPHQPGHTAVLILKA